VSVAALNGKSPFSVWPGGAPGKSASFAPLHGSHSKLDGFPSAFQADLLPSRLSPRAFFNFLACSRNFSLSVLKRKRQGSEFTARGILSMRRYSFPAGFSP
jgi:hypothetical protein